ncbi:hypothetical protein ACHAWF_010752 [Thalassiosira exigua]
MIKEEGSCSPSPRGRRNVRGRDLGDHARGIKGRRRYVLSAFGSLVLLCSVVNLVLHYRTTGGRRRSPDVFLLGVRNISGKQSYSDDVEWIPTYREQSSVGPSIRDATTAPRADSDSADGKSRSLDGESSAPHPRVACFLHHDGVSEDSNPRKDSSDEGTSCSSLGANLFPKMQRKQNPMPSIPREFRELKGGHDEQEGVNAYHETDTCKFPDPSYKDGTVAPPTCNDVHALGFDSVMFERGLRPHATHPRGTVKYLTMGGAKCVWNVTSWNGAGEETVIFKSHKDSRFFKGIYWKNNNRDALVSGGRGNVQLTTAMEECGSQLGSSEVDAGWNHILPLYQYCGLANVAPLAKGSLVEYMEKHNEQNDGRAFGPMDTLRMALQAARGLYQAQMYWKGQPRFAHADINPSQFLVFVPTVHRNSDDAPSPPRKLPILQINDFNQGRFLLQSLVTKRTCPFRSCTKNLRGNRWHTPERFQDCVDQNELVDTFSLGDVFFFLLTNGGVPYSEIRSYEKLIKAGKLPKIPDDLDLDHPAYDALKEVMAKCMALLLNDRPSSLEVVRMLEDKMQLVLLGQYQPLQNATVTESSEVYKRRVRRKRRQKREERQNKGPLPLVDSSKA